MSFKHGRLPILDDCDSIWTLHRTRVGIFYASASLSGAFGGASLPRLHYQPTTARLAGLLATAIEKMDGIGGLSGWRWIFILEGLITIIFAVIAWGFLPADLGSARFFIEEEREFARQCPFRIAVSGPGFILYVLVSRFRKENEVTTAAQVSEASRPINDANTGSDKAEEIQVETLTTRSIVQAVHQEDEKFEWGEVIRGTGIRFL